LKADEVQIQFKIGKTALELGKITLGNYATGLEPYMTDTSENNWLLPSSWPFNVHRVTNQDEDSDFGSSDNEMFSDARSNFARAAAL